MTCLICFRLVLRMVLFKVSMSGLHQIQIPVPSQVSLSMHMIKLFLQSLIILWLQIDNCDNWICCRQGAIFSIAFSDDSPFLLAIGGSKGRLEVSNYRSEIFSFSFNFSQFGLLRRRCGTPYLISGLVVDLASTATEQLILHQPIEP
ncbi:hypothetical protein B296_00021355 [Ensete ventricosum]|uniref:Uncharacterized protein n=1 Tax=Ensete ventricosum TaxID=4639 RepID=A0A426ZR48_ENSVE|nr:hypothetical protein B296_00021355 [Ensete ventricosum]